MWRVIPAAAVIGTAVVMFIGYRIFVLMIHGFEAMGWLS